MAILTITSELIRDYLDRHLGPGQEQALEEAMLADPEIAEQVRAEMALRRGFKELARREGAMPKAEKNADASVETPVANNVTPFERRRKG